MPATFEYYYYDVLTDFTFHVDLHGQHREEKNVFTQEKIELKENIQFEKIFRQYFWNRTPTLIKEGNLLIAYTKHRFNRFELDNFLHHKTVTLGDWLRGAWWVWQTHLGLTNAYYYDHIVGRSDVWYELEKMKLAINLPDFQDEEKHLKYLKVGITCLKGVERYLEKRNEV